MGQLNINHPDISIKFEKSFCICRRSSHLWVCLSSDFIIEQTLMRSLKTPVGLSRGSEMSEEQRVMWTMSSPITSQYNIAMQEFTNLSYTTSEQHKDLTKEWMKIDAADLEENRSKLVRWQPFSSDHALRNVVTGIVDQEDVNVQEYESVGRTIMHKLFRQTEYIFSFSKKDKPEPLDKCQLPRPELYCKRPISQN